MLLKKQKTKKKSFHLNNKWIRILHNTLRVFPIEELLEGTIVIIIYPVLTQLSA